MQYAARVIKHSVPCLGIAGRARGSLKLISIELDVGGADHLGPLRCFLAHLMTQKEVLDFKPATRLVSASSRRRDLKQSHSMLALERCSGSNRGPSRSLVLRQPLSQAAFGQLANMSNDSDLANVGSWAHAFA
jgi:hypothetical protein